MKTKQLLIAICLITASVISQAQTTGTFTDPRDGQVYKTITVEDPMKGTSVTWMAQNLNYQVSGAVPYNNDQSYRKNLGLFYTINQAKQACPAGWHIPSKAEFESLLKEYTVEALKSTKGWSNNGGGTNSSGFNVYPAGHYFNLVEFNSFGETAYFWTTANEYNDILQETGPVTFFINIIGGAGFVAILSFSASVRCIKNN